MKIKLGIGILILPIFLILSGSQITSLLSAAGAVLIHELGHALAAFLLKKKISAVTLEPFGARLTLAGSISYGQELLIALSGPVASFLLFLVLRSGDAADYSLFLGLINLLPVSTLDGGRVLDCAVSFFLGPTAGDRVIKVCGNACVFAVWLVAVYLVLRYDGGFGLLVFSCFLAAMTLRSK